MYSGFVEFDLNGGPPTQVAFRCPTGNLCPAVSIGRGDRLKIDTIPSAEDDASERPAAVTEILAPAAAGELSGLAFSCPKAATDELVPREFGLCPDQFEWLHANMGRFNYGSVSTARLHAAAQRVVTASTWS